MSVIIHFDLINEVRSSPVTVHAYMCTGLVVLGLNCKVLPKSCKGAGSLLVHAQLLYMLRPMLSLVNYCTHASSVVSSAMILLLHMRHKWPSPFTACCKFFSKPSSLPGMACSGRDSWGLVNSTSMYVHVWATQ